jgi:hypothetical protein
MCQKASRTRTTTLFNAANGSSPRDVEVVRECKPFFVAVGLDTQQFTALQLYALKEIIIEDPAVQKLWREKYNKYMASAARALAVEQDDYEHMIPGIDILISAVAQQPPVVKSAIRARVLAAKGGAA